jgi:septation ring formation regulator EzrA
MCSNDMYQSLRTECRARQCADKWKKILVEKIAQLKTTTEEQLENLKEVKKSTAVTESEIKQVERAN